MSKKNDQEHKKQEENLDSTLNQTNKENDNNNKDEMAMTNEFLEKFQNILQEQEKKHEEKLKLYEDKMKEMKVQQLQEIERYKEVSKREIEDIKKHSLQNFIKDLLLVGDSLKMGETAKPENYKVFLDGLKMTSSIFFSLLQKYQVEEIPVEVGDEFDEKVSECCSKTGEGNYIVEILKRGYKHHDRVIRATQVIVGDKV